MLKTIAIVGLIASMSFAAQLKEVAKITDAGIEKFTSAFEALGPDHPLFEDQASGDVNRFKITKRAKTENWVNTAKQAVHKANSEQGRSQIDEGSLKLYAASPSLKAIKRAFNLITGRIKDQKTEDNLKKLLDDAVEKKVQKEYALYSGDFSTSSNSCEVVVVQDTKKSELVVLTTCYNE